MSPDESVTQIIDLTELAIGKDARRSNSLNGVRMRLRG